jgi:two-component system, NarL family, invasion response regulator UvrY
MKNISHTVGLVDDHVMLRSALAGLINSIPGFKVIIEASEGGELLEMLARKKKPEIILLDITMPGMDGFDTCIAVSKKYPGIKILAFSMHSEEAMIMKMIRCGAKGYLLKSADTGEITIAFNTLLSDQYYLPKPVNDIIAFGMQPEPEEDDNILVELNERETEFLKLICLELSHKEIGIRMHLSKRTVDYYRDALFRKLNTKTRVGLVKYAIRKNII